MTIQKVMSEKELLLFKCWNVFLRQKKEREGRKTSHFTFMTNS